MAAAGVVTVSASVPVWLPMPISAANTGWPLTGGPPASAVSVPDCPRGPSRMHTIPMVYIPVLQLESV